MTPAPLTWRRVEAALVGLVGAPYARGGRGPTAFSCWGLVLETRRRLGLVLPPDFASAELSREAACAAFAAERPAGWVRSPLALGAIVLSHGAAPHAGVLVAGRVLHMSERAGAVTWSLGQWAAVYGPPECWEVAP